jgi:hypothetical protein
VRRDAALKMLFILGKSIRPVVTRIIAERH